MRTQALRIGGLLGFLLVLNLEQTAWGQYSWDVGLAGGTGNYLGDIGGDEQTRRNFILDLHLGQTKFSGHAFARYRRSGLFALKAQLGIVRIEDYDNLSSNLARVTRNAHFRNNIYELSVRQEVNLFSRSEITSYTSRNQIGVNAYALMGVTGFLHSPQARLDRDAAEYHFAQGNINTNPVVLDYEQWHNLRDFGTESVSYRKMSTGFPIGLGASFIVNYSFRVGVELVWNLTLTDYLDDVSTTWANPENLSDIGLILSNPSSPVVAEAAGATDPDAYLNNFRYDDNYSSPRGNPDRNDTYGTLQITLSKVLMTTSDYWNENDNEKKKERGNTIWKPKGRPKKEDRTRGKPKV